MEWRTLLVGDAEQKRLTDLHRTERNLRMERQVEISGAAREKNIARVRELKAEMEYQCSAYTDEIAEIESRRLLRRAEKQLLSEDDIQIDVPNKSHWKDGQFGNRFLRPDSMRKLARQVRDAENSARDLRMKYVLRHRSYSA
jgi:hypothetical protein